MKKCLLIVSLVLFPVLAFASPFLVCDPYLTGEIQPTHFSVIVDGQPEVLSPSEVLGDGSVRLHYDLVGVTQGSHQVEVRAVIIDPVWGRTDSASSPFDFTRPGFPGAVPNLKLEP